MSTLCSKFVIVGDSLYLGKVTFHKELLKSGEKCIGGGWFHYKFDDDSFTFYGDSHDFGRATQEQIQACVSSGNVGERNRFFRIAQSNFYYCYDITLMSERELLIKTTQL